MSHHKKPTEGFLYHSIHNTEKKTTHFCFWKTFLFHLQGKIRCCSVAAYILSAKEFTTSGHDLHSDAQQSYYHLFLSFSNIQNSNLSNINRYKATRYLPPRKGCLHSMCHYVMLLSVTKATTATGL